MELAPKTTSPVFGPAMFLTSLGQAAEDTSTFFLAVFLPISHSSHQELQGQEWEMHKIK